MRIVLKKTIINFGILICSTLPFFHSGCALFLLGAGAAGGYAISKDEIEGHADISYDQAWVAMMQTLTSEGTVTKQDRSIGKAEGRIGTSEVQFSLARITAKTVRIQIKARKAEGLFPDMELAQNLYAKWVSKIKS